MSDAEPLDAGRPSEQEIADLLRSDTGRRQKIDGKTVRACRRLFLVMCSAIGSVLIAVGIGFAITATNMRSSYVYGECRPTSIVIDENSSCVYVIADYGPSFKETACTLPAGVALRSTWTSAPGCFVESASTKNIDARERAENEAEAKRWRDGLNSSSVWPCAWPQEKTSTIESQHCAKLATGRDWEHVFERQGHNRFIYIDTRTQLIKMAIAASNEHVLFVGRVLSITGASIIVVAAAIHSGRSMIGACFKAVYVRFEAGNRLDNALRNTRLRKNHRDC